MEEKGTRRSPADDHGLLLIHQNKGTRFRSRGLGSQRESNSVVSNFVKENIEQRVTQNSRAGRREGTNCIGKSKKRMAKQPKGNTRLAQPGGAVQNLAETKKGTDYRKRGGKRTEERGRNPGSKIQCGHRLGDARFSLGENAILNKLTKRGVGPGRKGGGFENYPKN